MAATEHRTITVVVAGSADMYLDAISCLLGGQMGFEVLSTEGAVEDAVRVVRMQHPRVLVLDLAELTADPCEVLRAVRDASPQTSVVAILPNGDPFAAREVMRAGAIACLTPTSRTRHLVDAVWNASRDEQYLAPSLAVALADVSMQNGNGDLTERENEVLRLIALGYTNQEIAGTLFLSVRTIETHRARLQAKLGMHRRAELVHVAHERGLLG
jgi:two-component system response regulator NreC